MGLKVKKLRAHGFMGSQSTVGSGQSPNVVPTFRGRLKVESQGADFFDRCEITVEFINIEKCEMLECRRRTEDVSRC